MRELEQSCDWLLCWQCWKWDVGACSSAVETRVVAMGSYFLSEEDVLITESEKEGKYEMFGWSKDN